MLEVQRDRIWHEIVTMDESRFSLTADHKLIWLPEGEKVPKRGRHKVQSKNPCW
jgi:hypothetical protein